MSAARRLPDREWERLLELRLRRPSAIADTLANRQRRPLLGPDGHLLLVAADHGAQEAFGTRETPRAMADRRDLLERLLLALDHPRVDGVIASPDLVDDLAMLGALDSKVVIGTMNRGGLAYNPASIERARLEGGTMLLRIDDDQPSTLPTLSAVARGVSELAGSGLTAMVEPLPYQTGAGNRSALARDPAALIRCIAIASALGETTAYTWLKLPTWEGISQIMAATSMPTLLGGSEPSADPEHDRQHWFEALTIANARGYVIGQTLLYPPRGSVAGAIAAVADTFTSAIAAKNATPALSATGNPAPPGA